MNPLVSVITPVYNGEAFLGEAIGSVLAQTYQRTELIVVDDGSTDRTRTIAESFSAVLYVHKDNGGIGSARNTGIRRAMGEYVAFLDADNLWLREKLTLQLAAFEAEPDLEIVSGLVEQFAASGGEARYRFPGTPLPGYCADAILVKRVALDKIGWFPEDSLSTDVKWFAELLDKNQHIKILPQVVLRRRIHGGNTGIVRREEMTHSMLRDLKDSIDRKRTLGRAS